MSTDPTDASTDSSALLSVTSIHLDWNAMFADFDFSALDDPNYKEDAVREDLVAPLLRALGYQATGNHRMQRSKSLPHPFVMIGSQKRKINVVPDYTLFNGEQAILVLDAKRPSEAVLNPAHVEQAFSYAIHPDIRARSFALCNGRELALYDIDRSGPVFQIKLNKLGEAWTKVLKHLSPEALLDHHHRAFLPDLGIFLENAGFDLSQDITFIDARITSLGRTQGGILTATASPIDGMGFAGSFDMPAKALPTILSCLPPQAAAMATKALDLPLSYVWVGGVIEITWTVRLGMKETGLYRHDPLIPLFVTAIHRVSRGDPLGEPPDSIPTGTLNLSTVLQYL